MSSKKIISHGIQPEVTKEDLSAIPKLRNLINHLLNSEKDAKKAAQVLSNWLSKTTIKK